MSEINDTQAACSHPPSLHGWHMTKWGEGPPLIALHGWGQQSDDLTNLALLLAKHFTVYLFDLPGFGKSAQPDSVWTSEDYAKELYRQMHHLGISSACFFGHSFGGKVALRMAALYPKAVDKLLLVAPSGIQTPLSLKKRLRKKSLQLLAKSCKWADRFFHRQLYEQLFIPRFASHDYKLAAGIMRQVLVRTLREDLTPLCPDITQPTCLIWGALDTETPIEMGIKLSSLLPNNTFNVLAQHGHCPFTGGGAHLCAKLLFEFTCPAGQAATIN